MVGSQGVVSLHWREIWKLIERLVKYTFGMLIFNRESPIVVTRSASISISKVSEIVGVAEGCIGCALVFSPVVVIGIYGNNNICFQCPQK
jgi:hypothetical protein